MWGWLRGDLRHKRRNSYNGRDRYGRNYQKGDEIFCPGVVVGFQRLWHVRSMIYAINFTHVRCFAYFA